MSRIVGETVIPELKLLKRGKVRDIYLIDTETILIVATDRISAFDHVLHNLIPYKGFVLTGISVYWFEKIPFKHHFITDAPPDSLGVNSKNLIAKRSMVVKRTEVIPIECIVRGHLAGSALREYKKTGSVNGIRLPRGLKAYEKLPEPLFTPTTKEETGHDKPINFDELVNMVGEETALFLRDTSLKLFNFGYEELYEKGIVLSDSKFEYGLDREGNIILIDEIFTPDSSRYIDLKMWKKGKVYEMDKEFLREYLMHSGWDREGPPPPLPKEIVDTTARRYLEIYERVTGNSPNFN